MAGNIGQDKFQREIDQQNYLFSNLTASITQAAGMQSESIDKAMEQYSGLMEEAMGVMKTQFNETKKILQPFMKMAGTAGIELQNLGPQLVQQSNQFLAQQQQFLNYNMAANAAINNTLAGVLGIGGGQPPTGQPSTYGGQVPGTSGYQFPQTSSNFGGGISPIDMNANQGPQYSAPTGYASGMVNPLSTQNLTPEQISAGGTSFNMADPQATTNINNYYRNLQASQGQDVEPGSYKQQLAVDYAINKFYNENADRYMSPEDEAQYEQLRMQRELYAGPNGNQGQFDAITQQMEELKAGKDAFSYNNRGTPQDRMAQIEAEYGRYNPAFNQQYRDSISTAYSDMLSARAELEGAGINPNDRGAMETYLYNDVGYRPYWLSAADPNRTTEMLLAELRDEPGVQGSPLAADDPLRNYATATFKLRDSIQSAKNAYSTRFNQTLDLPDYLASYTPGANVTQTAEGIGTDLDQAYRPDLYTSVNAAAGYSPEQMYNQAVADNQAYQQYYNDALADPGLAGQYYQSLTEGQSGAGTGAGGQGGTTSGQGGAGAGYTTADMFGQQAASQYMGYGYQPTGQGVNTGNNSMDAFMNSPFVQSQIQLGSEAVQNSLAARGMLHSGETLAELQKLGAQVGSQSLGTYLQGINTLQQGQNINQQAQQLYNQGYGIYQQGIGQYQSGLAALLGQGQSAANSLAGASQSLGTNLAGLLQSQGETLANSELQKGQIWSNALLQNSALNYQNQSNIFRIQNQAAESQTIGNMLTGNALGGGMFGMLAEVGLGAGLL